jgi:hypothetical protein
VKRYRLSFELGRTPFAWAFAVGAFSGRLRLIVGPWALSAWVGDQD